MDQNGQGLDIRALLLELASFQPELGELFFGLMTREGRSSVAVQPQADKARQICSQLSVQNLPAQLSQLFYQTEKAAGSSQYVFQ